MPKGWVAQGSTPFALVMAPPDDKDESPDSFSGKLVVMLQSRDATAPPADWANQPVNGREGKFDVQADTQILTFKNASGQWVVIQAPRVARLGQRRAGQVRRRRAGAGRRAAGARLTGRARLPGMTAAAVALTAAAVRVSG
jgi:hypothetical protein